MISLSQWNGNRMWLKSVAVRNSRRTAQLEKSTETTSSGAEKNGLDMCEIKKKHGIIGERLTLD